MRRVEGLWAVALVGSAVLVGGCALCLGPALRPAPDVKAPTGDAAAVERGKYLSEHVAGCADCHSRRDWKRFSGPPIEGTRYGGGDCFDEEVGMPGKVCASNISSHRAHGVGAWTDGELLRAMREGVDRDDETLFPMMPYVDYRHMSDKDALAIVAYMRTLPAVDHKPPATEVSFPVNRFINFAPQPLEKAVAGPAEGDAMARGKYLANIGGCVLCHSEVDSQHRPLAGKELGGGQEMKMEGLLHVITPNISSHKEDGIGSWSKEMFVGRFKAFADPSTWTEVKWQYQTPMPWWAYSGMSEQDLGALFDYIQSQPPVANSVPNKFPASAAGDDA